MSSLQDKNAETKNQKEKGSAKKTLIFIGLVLILVLSVVSFVFIPVVGTAAGAPQEELVFGKWDKTPIKFTPNSSFAQLVSNYQRNMESQGQKISDFQRYQIWYQAYNMTVVRTAIQEELANAGYIVPEATVNKILVNYYTDRSGKFSQKRYESVPESDRVAMRKSITEELLIQGYADDIIGNESGMYGSKTSSKEFDMIRELGKTERSFYMAAFPIKDYPSDLLTAYGTENAAKFVKLSLSVITAASEESANTVRTRITNNEITFADAITEYSTGTRANTEGKVSYTYAYQFDTFLSESDVASLTELATDALSAVMKIGESEYGFFKADAVAVQPDFTLPEIISTVTSYMNSHDRGKIEDYFVSQARDFALIANKDGFDAACAQKKVTKIDVPFFTLNYGNTALYTQLPTSTVKELSGVQNNETFFTEAFRISGNEVSEPILTGSNVLVLTLQEERAAAVAEGIEDQYITFCSEAANRMLMSSYLESPKHSDSFFGTYSKIFSAE